MIRETGVRDGKSFAGSKIRLCRCYESIGFLTSKATLTFNNGQSLAIGCVPSINVASEHLLEQISSTFAVYTAAHGLLRAESEYSRSVHSHTRTCAVRSIIRYLQSGTLVFQTELVNLPNRSITSFVKKHHILVRKYHIFVQKHHIFAQKQNIS